MYIHFLRTRKFKVPNIFGVVLPFPDDVRMRGFLVVLLLQSSRTHLTGYYDFVTLLYCTITPRTLQKPYITFLLLLFLIHLYLYQTRLSRFSYRFRTWIVNTRLFQPPTTTRMISSAVVKQIVCYSDKFVVIA